MHCNLNTITQVREYVQLLVSDQDLVLQKFPPSDNIYLITTALFKLQQLFEPGKTINIMWIPNHVVIEWNELTDREAKESLWQALVSTLRPSISHTKKLAQLAAFHVFHIHYWFPSLLIGKSKLLTISNYSRFAIHAAPIDAL